MKRRIFSRRSTPKSSPKALLSLRPERLPCRLVCGPFRCGLALIALLVLPALSTARSVRCCYTRFSPWRCDPRGSGSTYLAFPPVQAPRSAHLRFYSAAVFAIRDAKPRGKRRYAGAPASTWCIVQDVVPDGQNQRDVCWILSQLFFRRVRLLARQEWLAWVLCRLSPVQFMILAQSSSSSWAAAGVDEIS